GQVHGLERLLRHRDRFNGVLEEVLGEVRVVLVEVEPVDDERAALRPAEGRLVRLLLVVFLEEALPALESRLVADGLGVRGWALDLGRGGHGNGSGRTARIAAGGCNLRV